MRRSRTDLRARVNGDLQLEFADVALTSYAGLAFHTVPTMTYAASSAWQHLVVLTHNLLTNIQIATGAVRRTASRKRTVLHVLQTIQSLRFTFFNRAAQLVCPHGALRLRLRDNLETRRSYERVARTLARAA